MEGTVRATCPQCQTVLRIPAQWLGQALKCKKCGAVVRSKAKTDNTAPAAPLPSPPHQAHGGGYQQAQAVPAPVPAAESPPPPLLTAPPPSAPQPGYPYPQLALDDDGPPLPAGYPYVVPPGHSYVPPPGYPPTSPPAVEPLGTVPVVGYPNPPPPGYAPQPPSQLPYLPHGLAAGGGYPAAVQWDSPAAKDGHGMPAPVSWSRPRAASRSRGFFWIGFCLLLTAGLVAAGVYGSKHLPRYMGTSEKKDTQADKGSPAPPPVPKTAQATFPRRLLFISITKYMYLNPLTAAQPGAPDRTRPAAQRWAYDWRIPTEKNNDQVFLLSDTMAGAADRLPLKEVVQKTYQEFCRTSRAQDRIIIYFGGHAIAKNGQAYIIPMEGEIDGEGWEETLIPLSDFYGHLHKCKATQKVVVWDVCRFNPEKGHVRPGSEPMTEELYNALTSPPPGIQVVVTCKPTENAMEFNALRPEGFAGPVYSGSCFLEAMKFVAEPRNNRMPKTTPTPADPFPMAEWVQAIAKRVNEMMDMAARAGSPGKQTVTLAGSPPPTWVSPDPNEAVAARFEWPRLPQGASFAEIKAVESEFYLPPMKPGLNEVGLAEFPFPLDIMKDYQSDGVTLEQIQREPDRYPFRAQVLKTFDLLRSKWSNTAATQLRNEVLAPINDDLKNAVKNEQEFWAIGISELEVQLEALKLVGEMRDSQPKRWQAHYDYALAALKARLAYMNEYNKLLGNLITETLPPLTEGQDGYLLVASETLKSGREIRKLADEAKELFQEIAVKYKGTPWAVQAKEEKSVTIGLNWKAASLKKE
ncbi:MAG: hypothetical protein RMJ56_18050 [Gemmataceae bacterium]|nr:zinc-ribbon domain-containing protein [Gemmata sp.]MDW8199499.1 hypothetical protein [Gemmataceae bacterium]